MVQQKRVKTMTISKPPVVPSATITGPEWTAAQPALTAGAPGQIKGTDENGDLANLDHRAHSGPTVASSEAALYMRQQADFNPSYSGSDADRIQAAIDQAQDHLSGSGALPGAPVTLTHGEYHFDKGITAKSSPLICPSSAVASAIFVWDGPDDGTMITKGLYPGTASLGAINGVTFEEGTGIPYCYLDTGDFYPVDNNFNLDHTKWHGGKRQIVMPKGFWNAHWQRMRFDAWRDYAIYIDMPVDVFLSSMVIDMWTEDHNSNHFGSPTAKGFMGIKLNEGGPDPGVITFANMRLEINEQFTSPNAFVHLISSGIAAQGPVINFQNPTYQGSGGADVAAMVYRDDSATGGATRVSISKGVLSSPSIPIVGGYPARSPNFSNTPNAPSYGDAVYGMDEVRAFSVTSRYEQGPDSVVEKGYSTYAGSTQLYERSLGGWSKAGREFTGLVTEWGPISDTNNVFGVAPHNGIRSGVFTTAQRNTWTAAAAGEGTQVFDSTLDKPIWSNGTVWKDASGTTV